MDFTMLLLNDYDQKYFGDNFFVITSEDDLAAIKNRLYGFAWIGDEFMVGGAVEKEIPTSSYGSFVNIVSEKGKIVIQQDYYAAFGLYLFRKGDFWALSNNMYYLVERIRNKYSLTLNQEYVAAYIGLICEPFSYIETIVSEISRLPLEAFVEIDIKSRSLEVLHNILREYVIPIDTPEAFQLIDSWHRRWNALVASIVSRHWLSVDLSGGFDTRGALSVIRRPNIVSGNLSIYSLNQKNYTYAEDFLLANRIGTLLDYEITDKLPVASLRHMDPASIFAATFFTKGPLHNLYVYPAARGFVEDKPQFALTGYGGEIVRDFYNKEFYEIYNRYFNYTIPDAHRYHAMASRFMARTRDRLFAYPHTGFMAEQLLHVKIRSSVHFGIVENFLTNRITLGPFMDPEMVSIRQIYESNDSLNLLFAIILDRFLPEIENIPFNGQREISQGVIKLAKELNKKYPYDDLAPEPRVNLRISERVAPKAANGPSPVSVANMVANHLECAEMKEWIAERFGEGFREYAKDYFSSHSTHPNMYYTKFAVCRMYEELTGDRIKLAGRKESLLPVSGPDSHEGQGLAAGAGGIDSRRMAKGKALTGPDFDGLSDRRQFIAFLESISGNSRILELGPCVWPIFTGPNVKYISRLTESGLQGKSKAAYKKYRDSIIAFADTLDCEEIAARYAQNFDLVFCNYNTLERCDDFLGLLVCLESLLSENGILCATIADKNLSYNHFRPTTTIGDILASHIDSHGHAHLMKSYIESVALNVHNDIERHWNGDHGQPNPHVLTPKAYDKIGDFMRKYTQFQLDNWLFTEKSFAEIINYLLVSRRITLKIRGLYPTPRGANTFNVILG